MEQSVLAAQMQVAEMADRPATILEATAKRARTQAATADPLALIDSRIFARPAEFQKP